MMIENLLALLIVIVAALFIIRHLKRILTTGEQQVKCSHCALNNLKPKKR